jgi:hypothetical protein
MAGTYIGSTGTTANTTGSNSIFIGINTSPLADGDDNEVVIAGGSTYRTVGLGSNTTTIGNSATTFTALMGDVGIGSTTDGGAYKLQVTGDTKLTGTLTVTGGTPGVGKVLTSDANGLATWSAPTGVTTLAAIGSTANANGASISGTTLTLQPANDTYGGVVTNAAQTFAGVKTFNSDIVVNGATLGRGASGVNSNTTLGNAAMANSTSSSNNSVAVGYNALNAATTAHSNVAVGSNALKSNTSGFRNTAIGFAALESLNDATWSNVSQNDATGAYALQKLVTGVGNVVNGYSSGQNLTSGNNNVIIGDNSANTATTLSLNSSTIIGANAEPAATGESNEIVIGYNGVGLGSNSTSIGNSSTTSAKIFGALTLPNSTSSSSTSTGALVVGGGVGIAKELNVGATTASTSATTGALTIAGGAGIAGALNVGTTATITGATTLSSTLGVTGNVAVNTNKFTVDASTGNTLIAGTIEIDGGSPGAGKVLVSDANGVASWSSNSNGGASLITATATMAATDTYNLIVFSGSTTSQTITLPSASLAGAGREITIKNIASVPVTINATAGNLISDSTTTGATSLSIGIEPSNNWIKAISTGNNWIILRALF